MNTGPLRLRQLLVSRILIEDSGREPSEGDPSVMVQMGPLQRNKRNLELWKVGLQIRLGPDLERPSPYKIEMDLSGTFEFANSEVDDSIVARVVAVNGSSMLYSAAREHIWFETSRGKWGPLSIPSVSFVGLEIVRDEQKAKSSKPRTRKLKAPVDAQAPTKDKA